MQALTLLNDPAFHEAAVALAERVRHEGDDQTRLNRAFQLCLARDPTLDELAVLNDLLQKLRAEQKLALPATAAESANTQPTDALTWTTLCSVLFNLHEFVTRN